MVCQHLQHLKDITQDLKQCHIRDFMQDLKLTYEYLQDHQEESKDNSDLKCYPIWLNIDSWDHATVLLDDIKNCWYSVGDLVLSSSCDAGPIKALKSGLMRFEKLLRALGCCSITYPTITRPVVEVGTSVSSSLCQMRKEGKLVDITYTSEGQSVKAHRVVLAAMSEKCAGQFSGRWETEYVIKYNEEEDPEGFLTFHTLSTMTDFAYEAEINWKIMEVTESDSLEERTEKLEMLLDLCKGADCWLMAALKSQVEDRILAGGRLFINLENVVEVQQRAEDSGANNVKQLCVEFIKQNQDTVNKAHAAADA